jgi:hypothetical protein
VQVILRWMRTGWTVLSQVLCLRPLPLQASRQMHTTHLSVISKVNWSGEMGGMPGYEGTFSESFCAVQVFWRRMLLQLDLVISLAVGTR